EDNLRDALLEPQPPADLSGKVMARIGRRSRTRRMLPIGVAAILALVVFSVAVLRTPTIDASAIVETADGGSLKPGQKIEPGQTVRTNEAAGAVLALADGSRVQMRPKSELSLEPVADGVRIRLSEGGVIVNAAPQPKSRLYVATKEQTVTVVGAV